MRRTIGKVVLGTVALVLLGQAAGIRPNFSDSAPIGLWLDSPITKLERGMIIGVCPPATVALVRLFSADGTLPYGNCQDTNTRLLLKPVRALPGDTVILKQGSPVVVNGTPLPNTIAIGKLSAWPDGEYTVTPGEVWIFSGYSKRSFDSRYFGPVPQTNIQGQAIPLLTIGNVEDM